MLNHGKGLTGHQIDGDKTQGKKVKRFGVVLQHIAKKFLFNLNDPRLRDEAIILLLSSSFSYDDGNSPIARCNEILCCLSRAIEDQTYTSRRSNCTKPSSDG
jgi:hypothetical protein